MSALADQQQAIIKALAQGPDALRDDVIAGPRARALMAMKVHANTIWHARLVALEDSFPRTRDRLGEGRFNQLSRAFLDIPAAGAVPLMQIGRDFPAFLADQDADGAALAAFEWAWLSSFHAADAPPMDLADLAGLDEDTLLGLPVLRHPAACCVSPVPAALIADHPPIAGAEALLLTRPDADVMIGPCSALMAGMMAALASFPASIGNLLAQPGEQRAEDDALPALIALIEAGALIRATGD